ncbi:hypothetical protein ACP4OV_012366 [Aristida adscensionis]
MSWKQWEVHPYVGSRKVAPVQGAMLKLFYPDMIGPKKIEELQRHGLITNGHLMMRFLQLLKLSNESSGIVSDVLLRSTHK